MLKQFLTYLAVLLSVAAFSQPATIMTWNLLSFDAGSNERVDYFKTVIDSMKPELLAVQELEGQSAVSFFHQHVLDYEMALAPFTEGPDSESALFYDSTLFEIVTAEAIPTALRNISWITLKRHWSTDTLYVFIAHLKAGTGSSNEALRLEEINQLRQVTDDLPTGSYFIVCGDFNFYGSDEPAYQRLLEQDGTAGYFIDPIGFTGTWNIESYAEHHTQSPRLRNFGGGASGGLDDRFDLILFSHSFGPNGDIQYMYNTSWAVGNDGEHYNDSINAPPNSIVSQQFANALHHASDHLPVVTSFRFMNETAIDEVSKQNEFRIMPNPSNGLFEIRCNTLSYYSGYEIFDSKGAVVYEGSISSNSGSMLVDMRFLDSGIYVLRFNGTQGVVETRIVKN